MPSDAMEETLLRKTLALPIFASDPFSSVAYATEAAMVVLVGDLARGAQLVVPALARRLRPARDRDRSRTGRPFAPTRRAAARTSCRKENLGTIPSLVAAAALLTDYVLTVAVSVAAGMLAITSAVPSLSS